LHPSQTEEGARRGMAAQTRAHVSSLIMRAVSASVHFFLCTRGCLDRMLLLVALRLETGPRFGWLRLRVASGYAAGAGV
jgi:hypothetical protein